MPNLLVRVIDADGGTNTVSYSFVLNEQAHIFDLQVDLSRTQAQLNNDIVNDATAKAQALGAVFTGNDRVRLLCGFEN